MKYYSLKYFTNKLKRGEPFSIARYGDGELYCLEGKEGGNSQGCQYTPELRADLFKSLENNKQNFCKMVSSTMLPADKIAFEKYQKEEWGDTEILPEALKVGGLKPFFDAMRPHGIVIISSSYKRKVPLPYEHFIETPICNTHAEKNEIISKVLAYGKPAVYLFACGMAATVLVNELHGKIPGAWFIDIGHVLDPFIGVLSRGYLEELTHEQIFRNI